MNFTNAQKFICCPVDKSNLIFAKHSFVCQKCKREFPVVGGIICVKDELDSDQKLSEKKWNEFYREKLARQKYLRQAREYYRFHFKDILKQLIEIRSLKDLVFLELGCGPAFLAQKIAEEAKLIIGIDFNLEALKVAKIMLDEKKIKNYLLINANILKMPIRSKSVDFVYGGGVIEHFKKTQESVDEIYRVLKNGGISFNTVPCLNLGSLSYRQIWGNIPNIFPLKQMAEFVHIKVLKEKHMIFGYEFSFLPFTLKRIHMKSGFQKIKIDKFEVYLKFEFLPKPLRKFAIWLSNNSPLFWPMIKVIAIK